MTNIHIVNLLLVSVRAASCFSASSEHQVTHLIKQAQAFVEARECDAAFATLSQVWNLDPDARGLQRLFESCLRLRIDLAEDQKSAELVEDRFGLSSLLVDQERYEEASEQLRNVVSQLSSQGAMASDKALLDKAFSMLFRTNAACCEWDTYEQDGKDLVASIERAIEEGDPNTLPVIHPFEALKWPCVSLSQATQVAALYARRAVISTANDKDAAAMDFEFPPSPSNSVRVVTVSRDSISQLPPSREKIRLGYLSPDFTSRRPMAFLIQHVFRNHDRSNFSIHLYSLSRDSGPEVDAIVEGSDTFTVLSAGKGPSTLSEQIKKDNLDILVDLCAYAGTVLVSEIMSLRPATIQISYMGFPGSSGAPYLDYMVVDRTVVPTELRKHYTEHMIYMPHCYFVNSHSTCASHLLVDNDETRMQLRHQYNLPENAFVFMCHSRPDKIDPYTFRTWLKALVRVKQKNVESVLWLLRSGPEMERNLRRIARTEFGLKDEALVFCDVSPRDEHLRRLACGDVFLDTPSYNAHTLGCDSLFAGVPMITLLRGFQADKSATPVPETDKLPSRVGASLLLACGLDQLVCPTLMAYEFIMVKCASNPEWYNGIRKRLQQDNESFNPLFDTERWVRNLELALRYIVYSEGNQHEKTDIAVADSVF